MQPPLKGRRPALLERGVGQMSGGCSSSAATRHAVKNRHASRLVFTHRTIIIPPVQRMYDDSCTLKVTVAFNNVEDLCVGSEKWVKGAKGEGGE
jgi:hypothetical protein